MASKTEKTRGARVRASRAKSRVTAKKKARADAAKPAGEKRALASYASAREKWNARTSQTVKKAAAEVAKNKDVEPAVRAGSKRKKESRNNRSHTQEHTVADTRQARGVAKKKSTDGEGEGRVPNRAKESPRSGKAAAVTSSERVPARDEGKKKNRAIKARSMRGRSLDPHRQKRMERDPADSRASVSPRAEDRGKKDPRGKRRGGTHPARVAILGCLLVASLAAMLWIYTGTGVLNVKSVEVRGNEQLDTAYLKSLSGITQDSHLLKMDVGAVEGALLSEPYVTAVDVSRRFPNTVVLEITERQPSAYIFQNGKYNLVAQGGMILESTESKPQGLVEIRDLELPLLLPGVEISDNDFETITSLLSSLPPTLREMAVTVGHMDGGGLYVESEDTTVIYGDVSELSRKNTIALLALTGLVDRYGSVEYIDISFPDHPVIKPAGSS